MQTPEEIEATRVAHATVLLDASIAVDTNEFELQTNPTPRYLVLEYAASAILHASQCDTFAEAALLIDQSETDGVDFYRVIDLNTVHVYTADRRTIGFNFTDAPDGSTKPATQRVDIIPAHLSTFQPAAIPTPLSRLNDREVATILHALRVQQSGCPASECDHFDELTTPLDGDEIDALCERINLDKLAILNSVGLAPKPVIVTVSGGVADVAEDGGSFVYIVDYDNLKQSLMDCSASGTKDILLEDAEREYLQREDPDFFDELEPFLAEAGQ